MMELVSGNTFVSAITKGKPKAVAWIRGNAERPNLTGVAVFFEMPLGGVVVSVEVYGLPDNATGFYGMHIHEFGDCSLPFDKTGRHYNPNQTEHPNHVGDMPPLLGNNGYAWSSFYDSRFTIEEIINKSIVIHSMRDDFTSQPAGDSGEKIGCGVIVPYR